MLNFTHKTFTKWPMNTILLSADPLLAFLGRVALSCAPVRALLRTHGLESTLMQRCTHGSAPWEHPRGRSPRCAPLID